MYSLLLLPFIASGNPEAKVRETVLRSEAPAGWDFLDRAQERLSGKITAKTTGESFSKKTISESGTTFTFFSRKDGLLVEKELSRNETRTKTLSCFNPYYSFIIRFQPRNNTYVIEEFGDKDNVKTPQWIRWDVVHKISPLNTFQACLGRPLTGILDDPAFSIESVEQSDATGRVRVHYRFSQDAFGRTIFNQGWMDFLPENHWALVEQHNEDGEKTKLDFQVTLAEAEGKNGIRYPKSITSVLSTPSGKTSNYFIFDFLEEKDCPESRFRLSFYGLPEPIGLEKPRNNRNLVIWLILGAMGLFLSAFLLRRKLHGVHA